MSFDEHGPIAVHVEPDRRCRVLVNGGITHGVQNTDPDREDEPTAYYDRTGPMGDFFAGWRPQGGGRAGVIGLGVGTLAAYARPGQRFTFFEIDPRVVRVAQDPHLFTFLARSRGTCDVVVGDGLECLGREPDGAFDALFLDAYVDDHIPEHLIAPEAIALYRRKLGDGGLLVVHVQRSFAQLREVAARARDVGLVTIARRDHDLTPEDRERGRVPTCYAVAAPDLALVAWLRDDPRWSAVG